jgi:hypothetical protein
VLPLNERLGANTVRPRLRKLRIIRIGILIAAIMNARPHPCGP